eukprot:scaffold4958_cov406-Prasinococcus_capsulatus_cf.AAC.7
MTTPTGNARTILVRAGTCYVITNTTYRRAGVAKRPLPTRSDERPGPFVTANRMAILNKPQLSGPDQTIWYLPVWRESKGYCGNRTE